MEVQMKHKKPLRNDSFIYREIDGETFVLSESGKKIITLNKLASFIWQRCDGRQSLMQIKDEILETFEVDTETAKNDISRFVNQMIDNDMVTWAN